MFTFIDKLMERKGVRACRVRIVFDNAVPSAHSFTKPSPPRRKKKKHIAIKECRWSAVETPDDTPLLPSRRQSAEKTVTLAQAILRSGQNGADADVPRMPRRRSSIEDERPTLDVQDLRSLLEKLYSIEDDELSDSSDSLTMSPLPAHRHTLAA
jgi:hypothetical protein